MARKYWFAAAAATMALMVSTTPMGAALGAPLSVADAPDISIAQRLTAPEPGFYGIAPTVATHPISGETIVAEGDSGQSGITLFAITEDGVQGTPLVLSQDFLASPLPELPEATYFNAMFTVTAGPSGRWLLSYVTGSSPSSVLALGFSVTNGALTADAAPLVVESQAEQALLAASYGADEGRYLLAYAKKNSNVLGLTTLERNPGDTGFDIKSDTETDFGFVSPNRVSYRSLPSVADTSSGWLVAFGTGSGFTVSGAKWLTVSESGTTLTLGTPSTVSSSASGAPLHPQIISTAEGEIVTFRYDSGVAGAADRYQVRGRWVTGSNSSAGDIVFASFADPISRVRAAASDSSLSLVWNAQHDYGEGAERVFVLTTPLNGDVAEPMLVADSSSVELRPDVAWSEALQAFTVVWLQADDVDGYLWAVWLALVTDPFTDDGSNEGEADGAPEDELAATGATDALSWMALAVLLLISGGLLVRRRRVAS